MFKKLTIETPEQCHLCRSGVFIANFERVICSWERLTDSPKTLLIALVFPLLNLNK